MITRAKLIKNNKEWQHRTDIPNIEGFKLLLCFNDGRENNAVVLKINGFYTLGPHINFSEVFGWKPRK